MSDSTPDWQQEIERIERLCVEAFVAQDIAALRSYFAPALLVNSPLERVNEGAQVLDLLQRGIIAHSSCEATIEHIRRHGDVVVVMGRDEVVNEPGCIRYELTEATEEKLVLTEQWASEEDLDKHSKGTAVQDLNESLSALLAEPVKVERI